MEAGEGWKNTSWIQAGLVVAVVLLAAEERWRQNSWLANESDGGDDSGAGGGHAGGGARGHGDGRAAAGAQVHHIKHHLANEQEPGEQQTDG